MYQAGKDMEDVEERRGETRGKEERDKKMKTEKREKKGKERRGSSGVCKGGTGGPIKFVGHAGVKCCTFIWCKKHTKTVYYHSAL